MNQKQHHGSQQSYQRHNNQQNNQGAAGNPEQAAPTTKFVAAKLPQAPLNFEDIYKDTTAGQGTSETKQAKKKPQQNSPGGHKTNQQNQSQKQKNKNVGQAANAGAVEEQQQTQQKGKNKAGQQLSAQKYHEESKSSSTGHPSHQKQAQQPDEGEDPHQSYFLTDLTPQTQQSVQHTSMPKLQTSQISQSNQPQAAQSQREGNRRSTAKTHQSGKKQKPIVEFEQLLVQGENRKSESFFSGGKHHKKRGRVIEPTPTTDANNPPDATDTDHNQDTSAKQQDDKQDTINTISTGKQADDKQIDSAKQQDPNDDTKGRTMKHAEEKALNATSDSEKGEEEQEKGTKPKRQEEQAKEMTGEQETPVAAGVSASASKATTREKPISPVAQSQPQQHSYRSNSEVVQKKNRKQAAADVIANKNKKHPPQTQQKIAELANKLRNNDPENAEEKDGHLLKAGGRYCSNSPRGSIDSKREYQNKINRDKTSDDLNITPKKNQDDHAVDEKVEESTNKQQLRRHHVDPDAKHGGRELLVISITVKNRIIEATVRQNTDLNKLYDRISLLGDFGSYPHKFKEIFFRYWKNLIDDAKELLKEEEQREQARKSSAKKSEERPIKILSSAGKAGAAQGKSKPTIQVSAPSDSDKVQGASKTMEENQAASGLPLRSLPLLQASSSQQTSLAQQLQSMPHLVQGLNMNPLLSGSNIEALLKQNAAFSPATQTTTGRGSPAPNDRLLQLMLQQQQQQNNLFNANANNILSPSGTMPLNFNPAALQQLQALSPQPHLQAQGFQQQAAGSAIGQQHQQFPAIYGGAQASPLQSQRQSMQEQQNASGPGGSDLTSQQTQQHLEERKQSVGSNPTDDQEPKQGQNSVGVVPSKDEQAASKPGHKPKKIKSSKVIEYTGSAKKNGQEQHKIQDFGQQNSGYQQQNVSIQVLSQSPLADQTRASSNKQSERDDQQTSQLGHTADASKQIYQQESASTANQAQTQKRKKQKAPAQRKKDDYPLAMSPVDSHSIIKDEQAAALANHKQGTEAMLSETVRIDDSLNKSILQTDQNVSSFLKVGVDQESIKTATSGGGSDIQQHHAHQIQPIQYIGDPQQQQLNLLASLNQMQQNGPNGANFIAGSNAQQSANNGAPNIFVGQNLLNNGLQQVTAANQNGNPQLMNFTFNNFNNHNLNGIQPQSNQQLLANQLNVAATGQQMLGLNLNAQDIGQGVGATHAGYGNAGNFVSHINTIGAIGVNINNFNNFQFNNGQLNTLAIAGQNPQQFINDVTGNQYQAGLNQQMTNQGTYQQQLPQQQSQQNGANFIISSQSQQQQQQEVQQNPNRQHANTSPTQQSMIQQQMVANQVQQHNSQQQQNHFLQQPQMNNNGNFFQSMPGPSSQQPIAMLSSGQTGGGPLGGSQSATSGATLPMSNSQQQQQSILSQQQTQPQSVTSLAAGQQNPPIMHQHHPGTSQIQGAIQNPQPYQAVQHLQQPGPSQGASQAAGNSESGARPQGGGATQGNQKGGAAVGQKMNNQMPISQQQNQLNPNLNLNLGSNGANPLFNTLQNPSLSSQALQLLGQPYQHLPQAQIAIAPGASGGHGAGSNNQNSSQLTQGPGGLQQLQKVLPMQANYMSGPPPPLPQPHLVGQLINQPGQNTNANNMQNKPLNGIPSGSGQQMVTAAANASARGAASAASVTLPNTGSQQPAQTQAQQTHLGIMSTPMPQEGTQTAVKQGAVAAAVHISSNSQTQAMAQNYSNRDLNSSSNMYQQKRTPAGEGFTAQLQSSSHQSQVITSSQPAGGGLGTSTMGSNNTNISSQQHNRRGNNSSTTGARGGDQQSQQYNSNQRDQRAGNNSGNNSHQQRLTSHKNSKGRQNQSNQNQRIQK